MSERVERTEEEWRRLLTPERYRILRDAGTEPPFDNEYWDSHEPGRYLCGACGAELFDADDKYDSGSGWPSFSRPVSEDTLAEESDTSHGMRRTEVTCSACGSHLGHVFEDGPAPTGLRYCMNSGALDFQERR